MQRAVHCVISVISPLSSSSATSPRRWNQRYVATQVITLSVAMVAPGRLAAPPVMGAAPPLLLLLLQLLLGRIQPCACGPLPVWRPCSVCSGDGADCGSKAVWCATALAVPQVHVVIVHLEGDSSAQDTLLTLNTHRRRATVPAVTFTLAWVTPSTHPPGTPASVNLTLQEAVGNVLQVRLPTGTPARESKRERAAAAMEYTFLEVARSTLTQLQRGGHPGDITVVAQAGTAILRHGWDATLYTCMRDDIDLHLAYTSVGASNDPNLGVPWLAYRTAAFTTVFLAPLLGRRFDRSGTTTASAEASIGVITVTLGVSNQLALYTRTRPAHHFTLLVSSPSSDLRGVPRLYGEPSRAAEGLWLAEGPLSDESRLAVTDHVTPLKSLQRTPAIMFFEMISHCGGVASLETSAADMLELLPNGSRTVLGPDNCWQRGTDWHCLPDTYLLGFAKTGTTDLASKLQAHQDVTYVNEANKEPHFWGTWRSHCELWQRMDAGTYTRSFAKVCMIDLAMDLFTPCPPARSCPVAG